MVDGWNSHSVGNRHKPRPPVIGLPHFLLSALFHFNEEFKLGFEETYDANPLQLLWGAANCLPESTSRLSRLLDDVVAMEHLFQPAKWRI